MIILYEYIIRIYIFVNTSRFLNKSFKYFLSAFSFTKLKSRQAQKNFGIISIVKKFPFKVFHSNSQRYSFLVHLGIGYFLCQELFCEHLSHIIRLSMKIPSEV